MWALRGVREHPNNLFRGSASETTGRKFHPLASPAEGLNGSPFESAETAEILSVMAGKTGINFERCNVASAELHNTRNKTYIAAVNSSPKKKYDIFEDETKNNVSWVNPNYQGKTLPKLLDELRALYKEKVGQAPQEKDRIKHVKDKKTGLMKEVTVAGWSPIREGVCPIKEDTKIEDFLPFIKWLEEKGLKVVRIDLHHDEGYTDLLTKERNHNHHAHVVVDWVNHETGRTAKLDDRDASEMQTQIALSLGMERGESKTITGKEHLSTDRQRAKAEAAELERVKQKNDELKKENEALREQNREELSLSCSNLQEVGRNTVTHFDSTLLLANGAVPPTKQEQEARDSLDEESKRDLTKMTHEQLIKEDATLRGLIGRTFKAIDRIGKKIIEIANNVPRLSLFSSRQRELLAREAEMEQKVADAQSEAEKAVEQAKNDQQTAIAAAQQAANAKVAAAKEEARLAKEEAAKAETEAKTRRTAALKREQEAHFEAKKYQDFNANFEQKISDAKTTARQEGYNSGYAAGKAAEKANTDAKQTEIDQLKATHSEEVEKLKAAYKEEHRWAEFGIATNPRLSNRIKENMREILKHDIWKFSYAELVKLFSGEVVTKTYKEMRNWKEIEIPVNIEVAQSDQGDVRVWYNDKSWKNCLEELKAKVIEQGRSKGRSV